MAIAPRPKQTKLKISPERLVIAFSAKILVLSDKLKYPKTKKMTLANLKASISPCDTKSPPLIMKAQNNQKIKS